MPFAKPLGHPVDEHAQARRQLARAGIQDMDGQRPRWKVSEHLDQRTAGGLRNDAVSRCLSEPQAQATGRDISVGNRRRGVAVAQIARRPGLRVERQSSPAVTQDIQNVNRDR